MASPFSSSVCAIFRGGSRTHFVLCGQHQKSVFPSVPSPQALRQYPAQCRASCPCLQRLSHGAFFRFPRACACPLRLRFAGRYHPCGSAPQPHRRRQRVAAEGGAVVTGNQGILCFFTEQHRTDRADRRPDPLRRILNRAESRTADSCRRCLFCRHLSVPRLR